MNSDLDGLLARTESVINEYSLLTAEIAKLQTQNKLLEERRKVINDAENKLLKEKQDFVLEKKAVETETANLAKTMAAVKLQQEQLHRKEETLKLKETELATEALKHITIQGQLDIKKAEVELLAAKEIDLKRKTQEVATWDARLNKEKELSRLRKEELDIREAKLKEDQAKVQRMIVTRGV